MAGMAVVVQACLSHGGCADGHAQREVKGAFTPRHWGAFLVVGDSTVLPSPPPLGAAQKRE
eukprot:3474897-Rhodomonas_salina.1